MAAKRSIKTGPDGSTFVFSSHNITQNINRYFANPLGLVPKLYTAFLASTMKTSTLVTSLASLVYLAQDAMALKCYGSGPSFSNRQQAKLWADFACKGYPGTFTGISIGRGHKAMCPIQDGGLGVLFTVDNLDGNHRHMDDNFCVESLKAIINACGKGGEDSREGWFVR
jgi:hypothetical protein